MTGRDIKMLRARFGLTQLQLAILLGAHSQAAVSEWETGKRPIRRWAELAIKGLEAELEQQNAARGH